MINKKIKLHILGVPMNKLGNWLIAHTFVHIITLLFLRFCASANNREWRHYVSQLYVWTSDNTYFARHYISLLTGHF